MILLAEFSPSTTNALIVVGLGCLFGGVMLLMSHRKHWLSVLENETESRGRRYEEGKFRRRALVAALISALGTTILATAWAREPRVFALMIVLMLSIVGVLFVLASLEFLSVGVHHLAKPDAAAHKALVEKYQELRAKADEKAEFPEHDNDQQK